MKAVIFDMDGVIIDSEPLWKIAEREVFSSLGVPVSDHCCEVTQFMTTAEVASFWYEKAPWENRTLHEVEQMVISRVIELIETRECTISGIKDFIIRLKSKGFKLGLATNSPYRIIPEVLRKVGVAELFDVIASSEYEEKGKPDPAIYVRTMQQLNVTSEMCLVVEDSYSGILAAKRAGMRVVAFTNGRNDPKLTVADYTIDNFEACTIELTLNCHHGTSA